MSDMFVNRNRELASLEEWWQRPNGQIGMVWGRRRVGKTALISNFAATRPTIFHTAGGAPPGDELREFSTASAALVNGTSRDLTSEPFYNWRDALQTIAHAADTSPVLLVLDEFPTLVETVPELPDLLRAIWDRVRATTKLRILLAGSAVRTMEAMQEQRAPLYGRFDLLLPLHPFRPHESSLMLRGLTPPERALVWGIVGGVPLYLVWWDQQASLKDNLVRLCCVPGGQLLTEGELIIATEAEAGELSGQILRAIATGKTKHNEIADAVRADPTRTLERLLRLQLIERMTPVTEDSRRTRKRVYRIADNFLAFWLGVLDRYRDEIARGLGRSIAPVIVKSLDDFMGRHWEEAFRLHLRYLAEQGSLADEVVAIGPYWTASRTSDEIDAVVLAGRERRPIIVGEAKWAKRIEVPRLRSGLRQKALTLSAGDDEEIRLAYCAREQVVGAERGELTVVARDIFA